MTSKLKLTALFAVLLTMETATAADDVIAQRRDLMLQNSHAQTVGGRMVLGKFSVEKATAAMRTLQDNMIVFPTLFPAGSDKGYTVASPTIWENMEEFKAIAAKLVADAKAAELAAAGGQESFRLAFMEIQADCAACHPRFEKK